MMDCSDQLDPFFNERTAEQEIGERETQGNTVYCRNAELAGGLSSNPIWSSLFRTTMIRDENGDEVMIPCTWALIHKANAEKIPGKTDCFVASQNSY